MAAGGAIRVTGVALLVISCSAGFTGRTPAPGGTAPLHRRATVYVANAFSGTVTPILVADNRPGRPIRVSPGPEQILIGPAGKTAFVAGHRDLPDRGTPATLTAIRTATNVAGKTLRCAGPLLATISLWRSRRTAAPSTSCAPARTA